MYQEFIRFLLDPVNAEVKFVNQWTTEILLIGLGYNSEQNQIMLFTYSLLQNFFSKENVKSARHLRCRVWNTILSLPIFMLDNFVLPSSVMMHWKIIKRYGTLHFEIILLWKLSIFFLFSENWCIQHRGILRASNRSTEDIRFRLHSFLPGKRPTVVFTQSAKYMHMQFLFYRFRNRTF